MKVSLITVESEVVHENVEAIDSNHPTYLVIQHQNGMIEMTPHREIENIWVEFDTEEKEETNVRLHS